MPFSPLLAVQELLQAPAMHTVRAALRPELVVADALAIQQIPAPTFHELARAEWVAERFRQAGLTEVHTDALHNVYGRWPGTQAHAPALLISAHTDTVFPAETDLKVRYRGTRIYGPGLGDNSLGVAGLLALLRALQEHHLRPRADLWLVANSREEGLGDLGGIRAVWERLRGRLGAAVVVEGLAFRHIYHAGIAVRRLRITCQAPGGHSWLHFGQPSALHGLIALGARILALQPPRTPHTTYNIGLIQGGHSVNSLATFAEMYLDLRSEEPQTLAELEAEVQQAITATQRDGLRFETHVVGDRPAGRIAREHPLVQLAAAVLQEDGCQPVYTTGSTDANIFLAHGLAAVTVGISYGGNAHRLDEYIETTPIADGVWHLIVLTLAAANTLHLWEV